MQDTRLLRALQHSPVRFWRYRRFRGPGLKLLLWRAVQQVRPKRKLCA